MSAIPHRVGEVGTRFAVRVRAPSPTGILEDVSLDGASAFEIEFLKPYGRIVAVEAAKDSGSNDIVWTCDDESFIDEPGTWLLSANVTYADGTRVRGSRRDMFFVNR